MISFLGIVPFVADKCGYIGRFGSVSSVKRNIELMGIVHYKSITLFKRKVYTPMYGVAGFHPNFGNDLSFKKSFNNPTTKIPFIRVYLITISIWISMMIIM